MIIVLLDLFYLFLMYTVIIATNRTIKYINNHDNSHLKLLFTLIDNLQTYQLGDDEF